MSKQNSYYIALLRGINVGGNNLIKMADLKTCFEDAGFTDVATYIQSGNVVFKSGEHNVEAIEKKIEGALAKRFTSYKPRVVVVAGTHLEDVVRSAPHGFGTEPTAYRYDVIFLKKPLTVVEAIKNVPLKDGVDQVSAGKGVLYFSRLTKKATQSKLSRIISIPMYQNMTIRNWNTTTKLLDMMEK